MNDNFVFMPKYIRQESDMNYGEKVTHENYNEKLNLNTSQGDYNTRVLEHLFSTVNPDETYRIPYLDKIIEDFKEEVDATNTSFALQIANINTHLNTIDTDLSDIHTTISNIISGVTQVKNAEYADKIAGVEQAGPQKYYGTDKTSTPGFYRMPPAIFADDFSGQVDVDGIYYIPAPDTVAESMLTPAVRDKLNRESISSYNELNNKPRIAGITLENNKTLAELGIQPVGNYITEIPGGYVQRTELDAYYTKTETNTYVTTQLINYATNAALSALSSTVETNRNYAEGRYARVQVGASWDSSNGAPKRGDILITV